MHSHRGTFEHDAAAMISQSLRACMPSSSAPACADMPVCHLGADGRCNAEITHWVIDVYAAATGDLLDINFCTNGGVSSDEEAGIQALVRNGGAVGVLAE